MEGMDGTGVVMGQWDILAVFKEKCSFITHHERPIFCGWNSYLTSVKKYHINTHSLLLSNTAKGQTHTHTPSESFSA